MLCVLLKFAFQFNRLSGVPFICECVLESTRRTCFKFNCAQLLCFLADRPSLRINIICLLGCLSIRSERRDHKKTFFIVRELDFFFACRIWYRCCAFGETINTLSTLPIFPFAAFFSAFFTQLRRKK